MYVLAKEVSVAWEKIKTIAIQLENKHPRQL